MCFTLSDIFLCIFNLYTNTPTIWFILPVQLIHNHCVSFLRRLSFPSFYLYVFSWRNSVKQMMHEKNVIKLDFFYQPELDNAAEIVHWRPITGLPHPWNNPWYSCWSLKSLKISWISIRIFHLRNYSELFFTWPEISLNCPWILLVEFRGNPGLLHYLSLFTCAVNPWLLECLIVFGLSELPFHCEYSWKCSSDYEGFKYLRFWYSGGYCIVLQLVHSTFSWNRLEIADYM